MCSLEKRGSMFILTLTGDDEHRLNPTTIASIRSHLAVVKSSSSTALVTTADGRFFSNGFDLAWAASDVSSPDAPRRRLSHMVSLFAPLVADFLSLPVPTVAAVTGHAAAAGFMLALCHDYVFMRKDKGVVYMSELDLGLPFPPYFEALMRAKITDRRAYRDVTLRAVKMRAEEAVERGILDGVCDGAAETVEAAVRMGEELGRKGWNGDVYANIRMGAFPELCGALGLDRDADGKDLKVKVAISKL